MRKILALLIICTLFAPVLALSIQITPVDNSGRPGDVLTYNITFSEELGSISKGVLMYMISSFGYSFSPESHITVIPGTTETVTLYLMLPETVSMGRYYETVFFNINDVPSSFQTIGYTVEGPEQYFEFESLTVPATVDPRVPFTIILNVDNGYEQVSRVYASVDVYQEDGTSIYYALKVLDTPVGNSDIPIEIRLNPGTMPAAAFVKVNLSWYDVSFGSKVQQFSIMGYARNTTEIAESTTITSSTNSILISNNGTVAIPSFDYEVPIAKADIYFIRSASTNYVLTSNSIIFRVPELLPGESVELYYTTDYSILYLIPFLFIGLVYVVYRFTRTVALTKQVFELKSNINFITFKVVLKLVNVSSKRISHLRVIEPVPPIVSEVFDYGTLHGELKTVRNGRHIFWLLGELRPNEEVILSYRMKSKVGLIGSLVLERGKVEVLSSSGKILDKVFSDKIIIESSRK